MKTDFSWNRCPKMRKQTDPKCGPSTFGSLPESVEFIVSYLHDLMETRYGGMQGFRESLTLKLIAATPDGISQTDIAQHLFVSPSVVVTLINNLKLRKLVDRKENPVNRRKNRITLTDCGRETLMNMHQSDSLPADACSDFIRFSKKIIEYLEARNSNCGAAREPRTIPHIHQVFS
jgi:DNA-binding MarR family transcriptional regulator